MIISGRPFEYHTRYCRIIDDNLLPAVLPPYASRARYYRTILSASAIHVKYFLFRAAAAAGNVARVVALRISGGEGGGIARGPPQVPRARARRYCVKTTRAPGAGGRDFRGPRPTTPAAARPPNKYVRSSSRAGPGRRNRSRRRTENLISPRSIRGRAVDFASTRITVPAAVIRSGGYARVIFNSKSIKFFPEFSVF